MSSDIGFKCPQCGKTDLQEVLGDVIVTSLVKKIEENGYIEYEDETILKDFAKVLRYQCFHCRFILQDDDFGDSRDYILDRALLFRSLRDNSFCKKFGQEV